MSEAVQAYLRSVAAEGHQLLAIGCFDVFLHPDSDHPFANYAIPRDAAVPTEAEILELIAVMEGAARAPRLEFLPRAAPAAEDPLLAAGFTEELRTPVMTCTPQSAVELPVPDHASLHQLGPDAEGEEIHGLLRALTVAFGQPYDPGTAQPAAAGLLRRIAVLAYAGGEVAGGGTCQTIITQTTELVGIGVLEAHRGRGIGRAITSELARLAFERGAETAFLTPGAEATARIYERAGFERTDTMLHLTRR